MQRLFGELKFTPPILLRNALMVSCICIIVLFLPKKVRFNYEFADGQTWLHPTLQAEFDFNIEKSEAEYNADVEAALSDAYPSYVYNYTTFSNQLNSIKQKLSKEFSNEDSAKRYFELISKTLYPYFETGIINIVHTQDELSQPFVRIIYNDTIIIKRSSSLLKLAPVINKLDSTAIAQLPIPCLELVKNSLKANITYDDELSQVLRNDIIKNVTPTSGRVNKGEIIIEKGVLVTPSLYQKLISYKKEYESRFNNNQSFTFIYFGQTILVSVVIILLTIFLRLFRKDIYEDSRQIILILLIITGMLVVLSLSLKLKISSIYLIPYCLTPIIIRILFDTRLALNIHLLVVTIASFFVPNGYEFIFLQVTTGMTAIYTLRNLQSRSQFLSTSLIIFINYSIGYIGITLINNGGFESLKAENFIWFGTSSFLTLLAYPLIYLFEKLFGTTSDITLLELSSVNSKLLRELAYKAPGTFQHSLQVANLAEEAIYSIGGNVLMVRAAAMYHDIGKINNPKYFIENQAGNDNPHESLSPEKSAEIIINHVRDGVDLAIEHQLPEVIVNFIRSHHGTTTVDYFYHSHLKTLTDGNADKEHFQYPGPIPSSKEEAVLMMADSVEAASRSLKVHDTASIHKLVEDIIEYKIKQNQLINSDITMKDISTIKQIFKRMLLNIYHVRIEYPKK
jgi:cyclic-di-AMP phosphodiesterase PgpH